MDEKLKRAIEEMAEGKEEGFNAVYSATYNHVYFRAKAYMKDEADAQDLTQIVYIEAYKNIKSLQNAESLFGWLDGICHNQGMKIFRKKKDVLPNVDEEGKDIFETLESNDITSLPELSTDQKETSRIIQEFIGELPEVQKAAVIAYYFDGFSVGEIAQMQDCSEGTVKSRLNYARKFLKDKVEGTEKRDGIRLHVVALPTLYYAIKLMSENTKLSAKAAEGIYVGSCAKVGLTPGAIALGNAGAGMSAKMAVSGAVKVAEAGSAVGANAAVASSGAGAAVGSGAAAGTAGSGIAGAAGTAAATGAGLSLSVKTLIIAGAILVGVGAGAGATYYAVKQNSQEAEIIEDEGDVDSEEITNQDADENPNNDTEKVAESQTNDMEDDSASEKALKEALEDEEVKNKEAEDIVLSESAKIQIVDAVGYFLQFGLPESDYVTGARYYAVETLYINPAGKAGFPWKESDKLDAQFIKDFYNSLGITIPDDYDYDDDGVTPDSDNVFGQVDFPEDYIVFKNLDITNNGDGTYILNGQYSWESPYFETSDSNDIISFIAKAVSGGNPEIFDGLIITEFKEAEDDPNKNEDSAKTDDKELYEKFLANSVPVHFSSRNNKGDVSYLDLSSYYEQDLYLDELIDAVVGYLRKDWGEEFVILEEVDYAYIDCGDDEIPELALHIISPVPDIEPWNEYIVIKNIDGRLETIYSNIAWSRYTIEMNEYGYISSSGSGGAYSNGKENGFLNKEGNYYDTYINDVEINPETNEETDNVTGMSEEESSAIGLTQKIKDGKVPVWMKLK
ncbi:RNA polymerase sigma factor [Butyrivibrio sp. VCD2006]|uniref:RNA polymerase sigma factor n=1 Tax=Butyrivibrio sp. VCD2006 TaxID=1280664 RepID=UPI0018CBA18B|nr:RNA polymerase sigma factor [Butyrivibrio sp. VCD2006]